MISVKLTKQELDTLCTRLPRGSKSAIAKHCKCSYAKVTRVLNGDFNDPFLIEVALKLAEEYDKQKAEIIARVDSLITKVQ